MKCIAVLAALALASLSAVHAQPKTWSYKANDASVFGPAQWGELYPACDGKRQSPIDIPVKGECREAAAASEPVLTFTGDCPKYKVKQLYDAFKIESANGTCAVTTKGKPYDFLQAHFHAPAEHTLNGKVHDAEVHFVHKGADGLLVVGLFLQKKEGATTDPYLAKFWKAIESVDKETTVEAKLDSFFPALRSSIKAGKVFNYPGSLTNPTCDETVEWFVLQSPLTVSAADFDALLPTLKKVEASDDGKAARPTQPLNGRTVNVY